MIIMEKCYLCIDLKTFYASVECVERGLDPFSTNLVVADPSRGDGAICLAITPKLKMLGIKNRCRIYEIPKTIKTILKNVITDFVLALLPCPEDLTFDLFFGISTDSI